jgi:hypothetical protein
VIELGCGFGEKLMCWDVGIPILYLPPTPDPSFAKPMRTRFSPSSPSSTSSAFRTRGSKLGKNSATLVRR